jgi:Protein of unknown function (DUF3990)
MANIPLLHPAFPWQRPRSAQLELWHGCLENHRQDIERGIDLTRCQLNADFGQGFYLTTVRGQAEHWAWKRFVDAARTGPTPVVLKFELDRDEIAGLEGLQFVRADFFAVDYWAFVQHCRQNGSGNPADHARSNGQWYDIVGGPVSAFWPQRVAMPDSDQFSFHTPEAVSLLDRAIRNGRYQHFSIP